MEKHYDRRLEVDVKGGNKKVLTFLKLDLNTSQLFPSKPRKNNPTKKDFLEVYSEVFYSQFSDAELLRNADYYQELAFRLTGKTKLS